MSVTQAAVEPAAERAAPPGPTSAWRRRTSTWLLLGWCALWSARIGSGLAVPPGREGSYTPQWWPIAVLGGLVLLGLCRVEARGPADVDAPAPARRYRRHWLILGGLAGATFAAHLVLLGPMTDTVPCGRPVHVNAFLAYPENCDSAEFVRLAHNPRSILTYHSIRQSRPGYVAIAAVGTKVVGRVAHAVGLDRAYGQNDSAYIPLLLINLICIAGAVTLVAWLLAGLGTPTLPMLALCGLVAVNDVTKAFVWTAHQQIFILLVPVVTIVAARWVLLARPAWWLVSALGLAVGAASLVYGSFLITATVVPILLARRWRGALLAVCFAVCFASPQLAWMAVCKKVTGDYYNHEVAQYDQFIWLPKAAARGWRPLSAAVRDMSVMTCVELFAVAALVLLLIAVLTAVAVLLRIRLAPRSPQQRATLIATGLTAAAAIAFAWGIGFGASRLMFHAVPPLLVLAGWLAARIAVKSPVSARLVGIGLVAVAVAAMVTDIATPGPYA